MLVFVGTTDLETLADQGSVWVVTGTDDEGNRVRFAGDWRPMRDMIDGVLAEGEVQAYVEDWQVLSVTADVTEPE